MQKNYVGLSLVSWLVSRFRLTSLLKTHDLAVNVKIIPLIFNGLQLIVFFLCLNVDIVILNLEFSF